MQRRLIAPGSTLYQLLVLLWVEVGMVEKAEAGMVQKAEVGMVQKAGGCFEI